MKLMREVRCFPTARIGGDQAINRWAGSAGGDCLEVYWTLRAIVSGEPDTRSGYLCNIKQIDQLLNETVVPHLQHDPEDSNQPSGIASAIRRVFPLAVQHCPSSVNLESLELFVSPYTRFMVVDGEKEMVRLTRSFEFSAAHRLHCEQFSEEENRNIFGKCGNPHGHGHNYVVEVTVSGMPDSQSGMLIPMNEFDHIVYERVITRYDHKHLNIECAEFQQLNPSVENIARSIWDRLCDAFDRVSLTHVRVWETPKTYAEYSGS